MSDPRGKEEAEEHAAGKEEEDDFGDEFDDLLDEIDEGLEEGNAEAKDEDGDNGDGKDVDAADTADKEGDGLTEEERRAREEEEENERRIQEEMAAEERSIKRKISTKSLSREQLQRYRAFRLSKFSKVSLRALMNKKPAVVISGKVWPEVLTQIIGSVGKLYVGNIIETGRTGGTLLVPLSVVCLVVYVFLCVFFLVDMQLENGVFIVFYICCISNCVLPLFPSLFLCLSSHVPTPSAQYVGPFLFSRCAYFECPTPTSFLFYFVFPSLSLSLSLARPLSLSLSPTQPFEYRVSGTTTGRCDQSMCGRPTAA